MWFLGERKFPVFDGELPYFLIVCLLFIWHGFFASLKELHGLHGTRPLLIEANEGSATRHISNPVATKGHPASACKRLHMMLRWLVRRDGIVDLGIWQNISPAKLMIPLDVHVARISRGLGLLQRKQNDRRSVEELTAALRTFSPDDPVKYDFALFGAGVDEKNTNNKEI